MSLLVLLLTIAQPDPSVTADIKTTPTEATKVAENLFSEAHDLRVNTDNAGNGTIEFRTKPRSSGTYGMCESDWVKVSVGKTPTYASHPETMIVHSVSSDQQYYLLTTPEAAFNEDAEILWKEQNIEAACARLPQGLWRYWVKTDHQTNLEYAYRALMLVKQEQAKRNSKLLTFECWGPDKGCGADFKTKLLIFPRRPSVLYDDEDRIGCDKDQVFCYRYMADMGGYECGTHWTGHLMVRDDSRAEPDAKGNLQMQEKFTLLSAHYEQRPSSYNCYEEPEPDETVVP
jgi:hypothetical protein